MRVPWVGSLVFGPQRDKRSPLRAEDFDPWAADIAKSVDAAVVKKLKAEQRERNILRGYRTVVE